MSTVSGCVSKVSDQICSKFISAIRFPVEKREIRQVMNGFESISKLLYCIGAIDVLTFNGPCVPLASILIIDATKVLQELFFLE